MGVVTDGAARHGITRHWWSALFYFATVAVLMAVGYLAADIDRTLRGHMAGVLERHGRILANQAALAADIRALRAEVARVHPEPEARPDVQPR